MRSIGELIAAVIAGEDLTAAELDQLREYLQWRQDVAEALTGVPYAQIERDAATRTVQGDEWQRFRDSILRSLGDKNVLQLRGLVVQLLALLRMTEDWGAQYRGLKRRYERLQERMTQRSAIARRMAAEALLQAITAEKERNPNLPNVSDDQAARKLLARTEPHWCEWDAVQQERKVSATLRRLTRARQRKIGHS